MYAARQFAGTLARFHVQFSVHEAIQHAVRLCALSARSEGSWPQLVCDDFNWLSKRMPQRFADLGEPATHVADWLHMVTTYGKRWNTLVSLLCRSRDPLSDGVACPPVIGSSVVEVQRCLYCTFSSFDIAAMRTHMYRKHGYRNPARLYIASNNICAAMSHSLSIKRKGV